MTRPYPYNDNKYRQDQVGERRARDISGEKPQGPAPMPQTSNQPQRLGDFNNLWGPEYENRTPNDWRRGNGMKSNFHKNKN